MPEILIIMLAGIITGLFFRNMGKAIRIIDRLTILSIIFLLFSLGFAVGRDPLIISSLPALGLTALALSIAGITGSLILAFLLWKFLLKDSKERNK